MRYFPLNSGEDLLTRKLSIIFNTRWGNDLCKFNEGILTYVDKLSMDNLVDQAIKDRSLYWY